MPFHNNPIPTVQQRSIIRYINIVSANLHDQLAGNTRCAHNTSGLPASGSKERHQLVNVTAFDLGCEMKRSDSSD